jgi:hypothetical protein
VEADTTINKLRDILKEELLINFEPMITVPGTVTDDDARIVDLTESGRLEVHLRRIGQESWDNTTYNITPTPKQIMAIVIGDNTTRTYSMEVGPDSLVADMAQMIYEDFPEHKGKMLEDGLGLPYELSEKAEFIVPASGTISVRVSPTLEYSPEQLSTAVTIAAVMRSTTVEELRSGSFSSFFP